MAERSFKEGDLVRVQSSELGENDKRLGYVMHLKKVPGTGEVVSDVFCCRSEDGKHEFDARVDQLVLVKTAG